jgi:hypothetical protein
LRRRFGDGTERLLAGRRLGEKGRSEIQFGELILSLLIAGRDVEDAAVGNDQYMVACAGAKSMQERRSGVGG